MSGRGQGFVQLDFNALIGCFKGVLNFLNHVGKWIKSKCLSCHDMVLLFGMKKTFWAKTKMKMTCLAPTLVLKVKKS